MKIKNVFYNGVGSIVGHLDGVELAKGHCNINGEHYVLNQIGMIEYETHVGDAQNLCKEVTYRWLRQTHDEWHKEIYG
jgi:hypothetical protein